MASRSPESNASDSEIQPQLINQQLSERWPELNDDDWTHLPIVIIGDYLEPGKLYFDLNHPERGTFKALGRQEATADNRFVAQDELDPELWRLFTGEPEEARD